MTLFDILRFFVLLVAIFAALTALQWGRVARLERGGRRRGMALNLARRAGPPVVAGLAVLVAGAALGVPDARLPGALLAAGGAAWGLHRGLADVRQANMRATGVRAVLSLGLALGCLWLIGLAGPGAMG
jgi:hypothetical protein